MKSVDLEFFFKPKSVAVVGASPKRGSIGGEIFRSLLSSGFKGKIYPVNPKYESIEGVKCYSRISEIPEPLDLVVLAVHPSLIPEIVEECGLKSVKGVVVVSGGFKEASEEGRSLEEEMVRKAKKYGIRVIGPNCIGVFDGKSRIDTFFQSYDRMVRPGPGDVAFLTQSGTYGCTMLEWLAEEGIGVSKFVSYGNASDVDEADLVEYLGGDSETRVIGVYLESVKNGKKFLKVAKKVSKIKPIVLFKSGRTLQGVKAALSHTGNLAGDYRIVLGALKQARVVVVDSIVELLDTIKAFKYFPKSSRGRIAMVTNGAGPCVVASDVVEELGLEMASYTRETVKELEENLPPYAQIGNPVDLTGSATTRDFIVAGEILLKDPRVDIVGFFFVFQDTPLEDDIVDELPKLKKYKKPIFAVAAGGPYTKSQCRKLSERGVPVFETSERAVKALYNFLKYYESLSVKNPLKHL